MWVPALENVALFAWYIGVLVLLEGLLSADNALVLAVMVRHLPKNQQRKVLVYGLWGAILFRFLALLLASILLHFWICKVIGGGYLLYLALSHFYRRSRAAHAGTDQSTAPAGWLRSFWGTVTSITLADIAFSIDSILAAVAMAEGFPAHFGDRGKFAIVFTGGVLGIITMRFVVRYFLVMLERFPGLEEGAYYLVAWIGLKLFVNGFHQWGFSLHIPELLFWVVMLLIAGISLVVKPRPRPGAHAELAETRDLLEAAEQESEDRPPDAINSPPTGSAGLGTAEAKPKPPVMPDAPSANDGRTTAGGSANGLMDGCPDETTRPTPSHEH
jgi:YkoY family integral membrane protein